MRRSRSPQSKTHHFHNRSPTPVPMARKRGAPPPPPSPQRSSSTVHSSSDSEAEEGLPLNPKPQMPPVNPQPRPSSAAAGGDEEESEEALQMRTRLPSPTTKTAHAHAAPLPLHGASDSDEEEDGLSPDAGSEVPEPVAKKEAVAAAIRKSKTVEVEDKKKKNKRRRPAPESAPSGSVKKAKAVATLAGKGKEPESTPAAKSKNPERTWSNGDIIKILEAIVAHVKSEGVVPKNAAILASVRDRLDRKDCSYSDLYEKVRSLKARYQKTVNVPSGGDELEMYNLCEEIWGENAKVSIAASVTTKSEKGQAKKEKGGAVKLTRNSGTQEGSKKGHAVQVKADINVKSNGGNMDEEHMDIDDESLVPKKASTKFQDGGTQAEEETHEEDAKRGTSIQGTPRSLCELQSLYPLLASCVERIETQNPCGETMKRAFGFIGDEKANALETKIRAQTLSEAKAQLRLGQIKNEVLKLLLDLSD